MLSIAIEFDVHERFWLASRFPHSRKCTCNQTNNPNKSNGQRFESSPEPANECPRTTSALETSVLRLTYGVTVCRCCLYTTVSPGVLASLVYIWMELLPWNVLHWQGGPNFIVFMDCRQLLIKLNILPLWNIKIKWI